MTTSAFDTNVRSVKHRPLRAWAILLALALAAAACSDDGGTDAAPTTTQAPSTTTAGPVDSPPTTTTAVPDTTTTAAVEQTQVLRTYVDESRVTPATTVSDEVPSRTIDVWIDLPADGEPVPLLIFAHGLTGHPTSHEMHRTDLAANGFVVAAPAFPLTNQNVPSGFLNAGDTGGQVGDVSFLIDSLLADPEIGPRIDPDRIGMIGHSLGGLTTAGAALGDTADERIDAAVVMSAGFGPPRAGVPVMVLHGDSDLVVPYASSSTSFALLEDRRVLVTLVGGGHLPGILDDDTSYGVAVRGLTAAFFAQELGTAIPDLSMIPVEEVVIEAATADGPLDDWRDYFSG